ncbi:MAG: hypothetical protein ACW976_03300 [Candidatus Ranarchaeia archaeon]
MSEPPLPPMPDELPLPPMPEGSPLPPMPGEPPMMADMNAPVLYWVLNFSIPDFSYGSFPGYVDIKGRLLIASRQLWSLMGGQTVRSCLIGPGVVSGVADINGVPTTFVEQIGSVIFDPTELRPDEPIPLIDIIHPEVIDPTSSARIEDIERSLTRILVRRGMVLAPKKLAVITPPSTVPKTALEEDDIVRVKIKHTTGLAKARFLLGGQNRAVYNELIKILKENKDPKIDDLLVLRSDTKSFSPFKPSLVAEWMIVEKMQGTAIGQPPNTYRQFNEEFSETCTFMLDHEDKFIF